jgi:protein-S-isoprenylcysteine O-methyltransferase Ste14
MNVTRRIEGFLQDSALIIWWVGFLFGGAGRITWLRGWICTVLYLGGFYTVRAVLQNRNPEVLKQRQRATREDTKPFDKIILRFLLSLAIIEPLAAGLDFRWNGTSTPFWLVYPGIASFLGAAMTITWVLIKNPHAESSVRIQSDRGHCVIASGPYRFVRHPMYAGLIQLHQSVALMLGSPWTVGIAALITILLWLRTALEDRTLRQELPGYQEYTMVTRYRLMPGVW